MGSLSARYCKSITVFYYYRPWTNRCGNDFFDHPRTVVNPGRSKILLDIYYITGMTKLKKSRVDFWQSYLIFLGPKKRNIASFGTFKKGKMFEISWGIDL